MLLPECSIEEKQPPKLSLISTLPIDLSKDFSSLHRLTCVYTSCFRFIKNARSSKAEKISGVLTPTEIHSTLNFFIKQSQSIHFATELNCLRNGASVSIRSKLSSLDPFLDEFGIMRVGGRLQQSQLPYDNKHPTVLHPSAHITRLIIESEHIRLLHAGAQLVHHSLRQRWWIINAKIVIRSIIRRCVKCLRFNTKYQVQRLGIFPSPRVTPSRPFLFCAVDYGCLLYTSRCV